MSESIEQGAGAQGQKCGSVGFYYTWWQPIKDCDANTGWEVVKAILNYGFYGTTPTEQELSSNIAMRFLFPTAQAQIKTQQERKANSAKGGKNHRGNQHTQGASDTSTGGVGAGQQGNAQAEAVIVDAPINAGTVSGATSSANATAQMPTTQAAAMPNTSMAGGGYGGTGDIQQIYEALRAQWNSWAGQVKCTSSIRKCTFPLERVQYDKPNKYGQVVTTLKCYTKESILHCMQNFFTLRGNEKSYDSDKMRYEFVGFIAEGWSRFDDNNLSYFARQS